MCAGHWVCSRFTTLPERGPPRAARHPAGVWRHEGRHLRVAWEEVLQAQPEVLVLALCGWSVERARQDLTLLQNYAGWDELPAVRRGAVYAVDSSAYFSRPGPRLVESLELLAGILHLELFPAFAPQTWRPEQVARLETPTLGTPEATHIR